MSAEQLTQGDKGYFEAISFKSSNKPLPGQNHRSSNNYDFSTLNSDGEWEFVVPSGISFDIKEDKTGTDPVLQQGVTNGSKANPSLKGKKLAYVSDPKGATGDFVITLKRIH